MMLCFLDAEFTGLALDKASILELDARIVDMATLREVAEPFHCVARIDPERVYMERWSFEHHRLAGPCPEEVPNHYIRDLPRMLARTPPQDGSLLQECLASDVSEEELLERFERYLRAAHPARDIRIAGIGVSTDYAMLMSKRPSLPLHYAVFDLRAVLTATQLWAPDVRTTLPPPSHNGVHRAGPDVESALEVARWACRVFGRLNSIMSE